HLGQPELRAHDRPAPVRIVRRTVQYDSRRTPGRVGRGAVPGVAHGTPATVGASLPRRGRLGAHRVDHHGAGAGGRTHHGDARPGARRDRGETTLGAVA